MTENKDIIKEEQKECCNEHDEGCCCGGDFEEYYEDDEILEMVITRKLAEIEEYKGKLSRARSEVNKKKYSDIINYLSGDIYLYSSILSDITGDDHESDIEFDADAIEEEFPDYYEEYYNALSEEDKLAEDTAIMIREEQYQDALDEGYYYIGLTILSDEDLLDAVAQSEYVVTELGRAATYDPEVVELLNDYIEEDFDDLVDTIVDASEKKEKKKKCKKDGKKKDDKKDDKKKSSKKKDDKKKDDKKDDKKKGKKKK